MDIVVDTSVIIAVVANEPLKETLVGLTRGADLIVPSSVHWEIGNALSAMLRRKRITVEQAIQAVQVYQRIPLRFVEIELAEAVKIAGVQGNAEHLLFPGGEAEEDAGDAAGAPAVGGLESGRWVGIEVFRTYLVPFELLSVLLLAAIFGAMVIARREKGE